MSKIGGVVLVDDKLQKERFGRRLALARMKEGLTQKGLALLLGFKQSEIGFYETGTRMPRDAAIKAICDKLNIDFNWLKYGDEPNVTFAEDGNKRELSITCFTDKLENDTEINEKIEKLSDDDKKIVSAVIDSLILERDTDAFERKIKDEIHEFNENKKKLYSRKKKARTKVNEFSVAEMIADLEELFPDIYQEFITGGLTITEADDKVQQLVYQKWPDVKQMIDENCKEGEEYILQNRKFAVEKVKPIIRKRLQAEKRKASKGM